MLYFEEEVFQILPPLLPMGPGEWEEAEASLTAASGGEDEDGSPLTGGFPRALDSLV